MTKPEQAPDLYEELPDIDSSDPAGGEAVEAADGSHDEVDDIAKEADPEGAGHGPSA